MGTIRLDEDDARSEIRTSNSAAASPRDPFDPQPVRATAQQQDEDDERPETD